MAASDSTWRIEMNCMFPGPTGTRCCSFIQLIVVQMAEVSVRLSRSWTQCVFPTLELWNDELRRVFSVPDRLSCSTVERNWVYVDNGTLRVSDSAVQRHGSVSCNYTPIHRGRNDFEVH